MRLIGENKLLQYQYDKCFKWQKPMEVISFPLWNDRTVRLYSWILYSFSKIHIQLCCITWWNCIGRNLVQGHSQIQTISNLRIIHCWLQNPIVEKFSEGFILVFKCFKFYKSKYVTNWYDELGRFLYINQSHITEVKIAFCVFLQPKPIIPLFLRPSLNSFHKLPKFGI